MQFTCRPWTFIKRIVLRFWLIYVLKKKKEPVDKVGKLCLNEGEKEATEKKGERLY